MPLLFGIPYSVMLKLGQQELGSDDSAGDELDGNWLLEIHARRVKAARHD